MDINKIPKSGGERSILTIPGAKFAVVLYDFVLTVKSETPNADGAIHVGLTGTTYAQVGQAYPFRADDLWLNVVEKTAPGVYLLRGTPKQLESKDPRMPKIFPLLYSKTNDILGVSVLTLVYGAPENGRPEMTAKELADLGLPYAGDDAFLLVGEHSGVSIDNLKRSPIEVQKEQKELEEQRERERDRTVSALNSDGYNGNEVANEPSSTVYGALSALETWVLPERGVKTEYKGETLEQIYDIVNSGDFYRYPISILHTTKDGVDVKEQFSSAMNTLAGGKEVMSKLVANPCQITLEDVDSTPTPIRSTSVTLSIAHSLPSAYLETIRTMEEQGIEFFIRVDREVACPFNGDEWGSDNNRRAFEATGTQYAKRGGWTFKLDSTLSSSTGLGYNGAECVHTLTLQGSDFSALKDVSYRDREPMCVGDLLNMAGAVMNVPYTRIRKEHEYIAKAVIELGGLDDEVTLYEALEETMRALGLSLYSNGTALIVESMNSWRGNAGAERLPWNTGREFWGLGDTETIQPTKAFTYSFNAKERRMEVPAPRGVLQVYTSPFVAGKTGRESYNERATDDRLLEEASKNILSNYKTGELGSYKWCYERGKLSRDCFGWLQPYVPTQINGEVPDGYSSSGNWVTPDGGIRPVILADGRPAFYGLVKRWAGVTSSMYIKVPNLEPGSLYVVDIVLQGVLAKGYIQWASSTDPKWQGYNPERDGGDEELHMMQRNKNRGVNFGGYWYQARIRVHSGDSEVSFLQSDDESKPSDEALDKDLAHDYWLQATLGGGKELTLSLAIRAKAKEATFHIDYSQVLQPKGGVLVYDREDTASDGALLDMAVHTAISDVRVTKGWEAGEKKTRKSTKSEWFPSFFTIYRKTTTYYDYRTKFKSGTSGAKQDMEQSDYTRLYALPSYRGGRDEVASENVVALPANAAIMDNQSLMNVRIQQVLNNIKEKYSMFGAGGYAVSGRMQMDYLYSLFLTLKDDFSLLDVNKSVFWYYLGGYTLDLATGIAEVTLLVPCVSASPFERRAGVDDLNVRLFDVKKLSSRMSDEEKEGIVRKSKTGVTNVGSYGSGGRRR